MSLWQEDQALVLVVVIGVAAAVVMGTTVAAISGVALVQLALDGRAEARAESPALTSS